MPSGAPDPGAPPCIRQRLFPLTAGDMQGFPERVLAPQRGLDNIGPILRREFFIIFSLVAARNRLALRFVTDWRHCWLTRISESRRFICRLHQRALCHVSNACLAKLTDRHVLHCNAPLTAVLVTSKRFELHHEGAQ